MPRPRRLLLSLVLLPLLLPVACSDDETVTLPDTGEYVVLAWNDLGMHCLNPTYDAAHWPHAYT